MGIAVVKSFQKDVDAKKDYGFDWTDWLAEVGDTLATSTWSVSPNDSILEVLSDDNDTTQTTIWVQGGTPKERYTLTNHITTTGGRNDDRSLLIVINDQ